MAIVTRAAREAARDRNQPPCKCGHGMHQHHEYRSTWRFDADEDDLVEVRHPRYRAGLFRCDACECELGATR